MAEQKNKVRRKVVGKGKETVSNNKKETLVTSTNQPEYKEESMFEQEVQKLAAGFFSKVVVLAKKEASKIEPQQSTPQQSTQSNKDRTPTVTTNVRRGDGKVSHIKEELLSGKTDNDLVEQGFNLNTIRTIKWQLKRAGELTG